MNFLTNNNTPQPTQPPVPPDESPTLSQVYDIVNKEKEDRNKAYNKLPTREEYVRLESDIKHLWKYIGLILTIVIASVTVYMHIDGKISSLDLKIGTESKFILENQYHIQKSLNDDVRFVNKRVDDVILHFPNYLEPDKESSQ